MSYLTGTILERNERKDDKYDVVRVVGVDPTKRSDDAAVYGEWVGSGSSRVLIQPHEDFGETVPALEGFLNQEYFISSEPNADARGVMPAVEDRGGNAPSNFEPSPEQRFAEESRDAEFSIEVPVNEPEEQLSSEEAPSSD